MNLLRDICRCTNDTCEQREPCAIWQQRSRDAKLNNVWCCFSNFAPEENGICKYKIEEK